MGIGQSVFDLAPTQWKGKYLQKFGIDQRDIFFVEPFFTVSHDLPTYIKMARRLPDFGKFGFQGRSQIWRRCGK